MATEMLIINYFIETRKVGSRCSGCFEIDADDWNAMSDEEKDEEAKQWAFEEIEWSYEVAP